LYWTCIMCILSFPTVTFSELVMAVQILHNEQACVVHVCLFPLQSPCSLLEIHTVSSAGLCQRSSPNSSDSPPSVISRVTRRTRPPVNLCAPASLLECSFNSTLSRSGVRNNHQMHTREENNPAVQMCDVSKQPLVLRYCRGAQIWCLEIRVNTDQERCLHREVVYNTYTV